MGLRDHYAGGTVEKLVGRVVTSDPVSGKIEVVAKDAAILTVGVTSLPMVFRWPNVGETWIVTRENGYWYLTSRIPGFDEPGLSLNLNEVRIDGNIIKDANGNTLATANQVSALDTRLVAVESITGASGNSAWYTVLGNTFTAIQAKINQASANGGGLVWIPAGLYQGSTSINIKDNVVVRGMSQGSTILRATSGIVNGVIVGLSGDTVTDAIISDLTVDANNLNVNGIQVTNGARIYMEQIAVNNAARGIWLNNTTDSMIEESRINNCSLRGIEASGARTQIIAVNIDTTADTGISFNNAPDSRVERSRIVFTGATGATKHCIEIQNASHRVWITLNRCFPTGGMGVHGTNSTGLRIIENQIDSSGGTLECVGIDPGCTDSLVRGNHLINGRDNGLSLSGARSHCTDNYIDSPLFMGIQINGDNMVVCDNIVRHAGNTGGSNPWAGIDLNNASHCIVTGNRCYDDNATPTQKYGLVSRGTADFNTIGVNDFSLNTVAETLLVGTHNTVYTP